MTAIYHITHIDNLLRIIQAGGLWCDAECTQQGIQPVGIAYANLKDRRSRTRVPELGGVLADYVPFYFANRSPMLGAIHTRSEERRVGKECNVECRSRWSPYH